MDNLSHFDLAFQVYFLTKRSQFDSGFFRGNGYHKGGGLLKEKQAMKNKTYLLCEMAGRVSGETPEQIFAEQRNMPYGGIERAIVILKYDESPIGIVARALFPCITIVEID